MNYCFLCVFFDRFLVTAITSVEGTFHSVFFFGGRDIFLRVVIVICSVLTHIFLMSKKL